MALVPTVLSDRTSPTGRDRPFRRNPHVSSQIRHPADGFPLIAGTVIMLGGYQALTATLLAIAALELAISAKLPTGGVGLFRTSLTHRAEPAEISSAPVPGVTGKDLLLAHQRRTTTNDRCN